MSERNLLEGLSPVTQTVESGKALAKFLGMKEELHETIALANGARLTLSSKKDAYYYTTLQSCTCMAGQNHKICRHRRDLCEATREAQKATQPRGQTLAEAMEEHDRNLHNMPASYQRMVQMAREEAEAEEEPIPESQCSKAVCKPVSEEERAAKIAAAREKIEESKLQAREKKERQQIARAQAGFEPMELIHKGGFKPVFPEEA